MNCLSGKQKTESASPWPGDTSFFAQQKQQRLPNQEVTS